MLPRAAVQDEPGRRQAAQGRRRKDDVARRAGLEPEYRGEEEGFDLAIRLALRQDLKGWRLSRDQVAEALGALLERSITRAQVDAWVADTHAHRFPADLVPAWVRVTGSRRLIDLLAAECGLWAADEDEWDLAEMAREQIRKEKSEGVVERLKSKLWGRV